MELNLKTGRVNVDGVNVIINDLVMVKKIHFSFDKIDMMFLYVDDGDYLFMYEDLLQYNELIKLVAGQPEKVAVQLKEYQNDFGVEHELWKQLLKVTIKKFDLNKYSYCDKWGIPCTSDYLSHHYNKDYLAPKKIDSVSGAYELFVSVLPDNIDATMKKHLKKEAENVLKRFSDICGKNLENKEAYIAKLEAENGNSIESWYRTVKELENIKVSIQNFSEEKIWEIEYVYDVSAFFEFSMNYAYGRVRKLNEEELYAQLGTVGDLKKRLRESINRLGFMELLELFKEYKNQENYLNSKARQSGLGADDEIYREYIDIYRLGSVLISDRMNKINRNKAKSKHISQELLDEAMIFYYEAKSAQDAYSAQSNEKYSQDKESGDKGEQKVEYALKWLDSSFVKIAKKSNDRIGDECIYICNPAFIDEKQEYDHLLVSNKGVFNIETKNYAGKLIIDQYGNWIRKRAGEEEGIKNPLQQIRQHEKILQSFLPKECKVISIICVANDKAIIEGVENCPIPIVKSDMLVEYLENYKLIGLNMTDSQKEQCIEAVYEHMV